MKTLEQYLINKVIETRAVIARYKEAIISTATSKTIELDRLQGYTQKLEQVQDDWKFYTEEICKECSVDFVIANKEVLNEYAIRCAYNHTNKVSLEDASKLTAAFYNINPQIKKT